MVDTFQSGLIGLLGVITGGLITGYWGWAADRRRARADLYKYAFKSLAKWKTLPRIREGKADELGDEVHLLGESLENYLARVPGLSRSGERTKHLKIAWEMRRLFDERNLHDPNGLVGLSEFADEWEKRIESAFNH